MKKTINAFLSLLVYKCFIHIGIFAILQQWDSVYKDNNVYISLLLFSKLVYIVNCMWNWVRKHTVVMVAIDGSIENVIQGLVELFIEDVCKREDIDWRCIHFYEVEVEHDV